MSQDFIYPLLYILEYWKIRKRCESSEKRPGVVLFITDIAQPGDQGQAMQRLYIFWTHPFVKTLVTTEE